MAGFPAAVPMVQAPAVAGDFASENPRRSLLTSSGGLVATSAGLTIGLFAWLDATGTVLANTGTGVPSAFIHRNLQATITTYLAESGMLIPGGMAVGDAFTSGDFWVRNAGGSAVTIGMKAFANNTTGVATFAAPGGSVSGATESKWYAWTPGAASELIKISDTPPG